MIYQCTNIGYVSRNELTITNTEYNINGNNNTLVLQDYAGASQSFTIQVGNYTVSTLMSALNSAFVQGVGNFQSIIVPFSDCTNKYTFTTGSNTFIVEVF